MILVKTEPSSDMGHLDFILKYTPELSSNIKKKITPQILDILFKKSKYKLQPIYKTIQTKKSQDNINRDLQKVNEINNLKNKYGNHVHMLNSPMFSERQHIDLSDRHITQLLSEYNTYTLTFYGKPSGLIYNQYEKIQIKIDTLDIIVEVKWY